MDRTGVILKAEKNLNKWKSEFAIETKNRTLSHFFKNADVFLGLSAKGIFLERNGKKMSKNL